MSKIFTILVSLAFCCQSLLAASNRCLSAPLTLQYAEPFLPKSKLETLIDATVDKISSFQLVEKLLGIRPKESINSEFDIKGPPLGWGNAGAVFRGQIPLRLLSVHRDLATMPIAVKISRYGDYASLVHEAAISAILKTYDGNNLFVPVYFDPVQKVLFSGILESHVSLKFWLDNTPGIVKAESIKKISTQLDLALQTLAQARIVHSDLALENILIDPVTLKIKIIDYGIATPIGTFPKWREFNTINRRGGRLQSENQKADLPAKLEDDVYAIEQIKRMLQTKAQIFPPNKIQISELSPLSKFSAKSDQWLFMITRNGLVHDSGYPDRLWDATTRIFEPYLQNCLRGIAEDFKGMQRDFHRLMTAGANANNRYFGSSLLWLNKLLGVHAMPGLFRNERTYGPKSIRMRLVIDIDAKLNGNNSLPIDGKKYFINLENIPEDHLPFAKKSKNKIIFSYPLQDSVDIYLSSMEKDLNAVAKIIANKLDPQFALDHLANYVQKGVVGHLFGLGNYSIYMTQANVMLMHLGYQPISPANLDYHALIENSEIFQETFRTAVLKAQK